jgi:hypothetical protein
MSTKQNQVEPPDSEWQITLNSYERANLLWLLCDLLGYSRDGVVPFTYANTGDWVGQIANKLRVDHNDPNDQPQSNVTKLSPDELRMFHPRAYKLLVDKNIPVEKWICLLDPDTGTIHFRCAGSLFNIYETLAESYVRYAR